MSIVHCKCPKWKYKELKTTCACGGIAYYQKMDKITEQNDKKIILEKLKKELRDKRTDIAILKMEIQDLENELEDSTDSEECTLREGFNALSSMRDGSLPKSTLSNGAVVSKAGLPNCDCRSCN